MCTDPDAELIRVGITEAAVEQAHGRVRGINRTASNPVEVYLVLGDVVVPGLEVDEVVKFQKIEPGPVEEMRRAGMAAGVARRTPTGCFPGCSERRRPPNKHTIALAQRRTGGHRFIRIYL